MALEIEHKFLLANDGWRPLVSRSARLRQGYLSSPPAASVRVRVCGGRAWLNIKSAVVGSHRDEYEYEIPVADGEAMLDALCAKPLVEKIRHIVVDTGNTWEIDEFLGENQGLVVAEIELDAIGQPFARPSWLGLEVTDDCRYYNNNLAVNPYSRWEK